MLERLFIKNFATIEDLEVEFESGFLALSGETGSGKSIIVSALSLLLGEKSSFDKIRNGAKKAFIEGCFRVENKKKIDKINEFLDEEIEDGELIITRTLDVNSKTTIKVNSHVTTLNVLKKISSYIIDIHSQQKDADYLNKDNQLSLLDGYMINYLNSEAIEILSSYKNKYDEYKNIVNKIDELNKKQQDLGELDVLIYQCNELEKADIKENEMEDLENERRELTNFSRFTERLQTFLNEYKEASDHLYKAKKELSYINEDGYDELSEKYTDAYYILDEIYHDIEEKFESYSYKIQKLDQIQERLYLLHSLRKKYGYTTEDILNTYQNIKNSIDELTNFDRYLNDLNTQKTRILSELNEITSKLTNARKKSAKMLENDLNNELNDLCLENAEFRIDFNYLDDFLSSGIDQITFMLKANAGGNFLNLEKTASLGETSRLNLALKTVFNNISPKETIIFDEIDIGLSGKVANVITKKMKLISKKSQVIAISHLPSVCAGAKYHYFVKKEVINDNTYSNIKLLNKDERIIEIAKMISGVDNESSLKVAKELLNSFID